MIVEEKPSIDGYILEHYGVKGMKWGVRRSQAALDRAAGRTPSRSRMVKDARKDVLGKRRAEIKSADSLAKKAEMFLMGEFSNNLSLEYRANPNRKVAFQRTTGEKVALSLAAIPSFGGAIAVELGNRSMNKSIITDQQLAELLVKNQNKK